MLANISRCPILRASGRLRLFSSTMATYFYTKILLQRTSSTLLNFIRYEGQRIRVSHLSVALPYIMYKCNTWVSKSDALPFIPNKIEQSRAGWVTVFLCVEICSHSTRKQP